MHHYVIAMSCTLLPNKIIIIITTMLYHKCSLNRVGIIISINIVQRKVDIPWRFTEQSNEFWPRQCHYRISSFVVFNSYNYQNFLPFWTYVIETSARLQTIICYNLQMISDLIDKLRCNIATIAFKFLYCTVIFVPMNNFIQVLSSFGTCFSVCQSKRITM
jgi:hypothetical protein